MCKHARVRPYTCKICGWTSSYHGNMWKHVETHRRELGDAMPEEPVSVISTEGHLVAAPLKAPTLKKRGGGGSTSPSSASKSPKLRIKRSSRPRYEEMQVTVETQVHDDSMKEGVVIQVKRVSCAIGTHFFNHFTTSLKITKMLRRFVFCITIITSNNQYSNVINVETTV